MISSDKMPSWGYWIKNGATSLYEQWDGHSSLNHPSMGSINAWLYKSLGGINIDPNIPYFRHIIIKPSYKNDLTWVKANYNSIQGLISSEWKRNGKEITLQVIIPANTTATIYTGSKESKIMGNDVINEYVTEGKDNDNYILYNVKSGTYKLLINLE